MLSQPYLSLLEKELRRVREKLARKAATAFRLSAVKLPVETDWNAVETRSEAVLAGDLAALGYPGFSHLKPGRQKNPAEVLLSALFALPRETADVDVLPIASNHEIDSVIATAVEGSALHQRYGVYLQVVALAPIPAEYQIW